MEHYEREDPDKRQVQERHLHGSSSFVTFLRYFADFLQRWKDSRKPGLTHETFLALRHTSRALADCASYMLDRLAFNYVLLGHLQSDAIESRFGWLRQLSGANHFLSTRQVFEGDRKIRAL